MSEFNSNEVRLCPVCTTRHARNVECEAQPSDLDKKLDEALDTVILDGQFQSAREFIILIGEKPELEHYENPMQQRLVKAKAKIPTNGNSR